MIALQKAKPAFGFEAALLNKVKQDSIRFLSFDVFDTLVFRRVSHAHDVFTKAFFYLKEKQNLPINAAEYSELRVHAENNARRQNASEDITVNDIFSHLPFSDSTKELAIKSEIQAEKNLFYLNDELIECIHSLRQAGLDIVLISDMYLNAETIRETFFKKNPVLMDLPLYVSCESGCSKKQGGLYTKVANLRNWAPKKWLHIGDNPAADFEAPIRLGLHSFPFYSCEEYRQILAIERNHYQSRFTDNALRIKSAAISKSSPAPAAFHLGAFVWGPLFLGFADWCIQKCLAIDCRTIVCLMREANVFAPLIKLRLDQARVQNICVKTLSASRKSSFWAAIDTTEDDWYLKAFNEISAAVGSSFRSYTVHDFYCDAGYTEDEFSKIWGQIEIRKLGSIFYEEGNALGWLKNKLIKNHYALETFIKQQKRLFQDYFNQQVNTSLSSCAIVDLGNGGTISHHMEKILKQKAKLNLLFYSSERIYRFSPPLMASGFIGQHNCQFRTHKLLQRSQESIEPLLVGVLGSCVAYRRLGISPGEPEQVIPVLSPGIEENTVACEAFLQGLKAYFYNAHQCEQTPSYQAEQLEAILARYINFPTQYEAELFRKLEHEDNFGSRNHYPVIDENQLATLKQYGLEKAWQDFSKWRKWKQGTIHWPQAALTLIDKYFLREHAGLLSADNKHAQNELFRKIERNGWSAFVAYGAGEFFEQALSDIQRNSLELQCVVDKKADVKGHYTLQSHSVVDLNTALSKGYKRFVIFSLAFQQDIVKHIQASARHLNIYDIEIISC